MFVHKSVQNLSVMCSIKKALMYLKAASLIVTFGEFLKQLNCKKKKLINN